MLVSAGGAADDIAGKGLKALDPARYGTLLPPRRRLRVRHLHPGRPGPAQRRRRRPRRPRARAGAGRRRVAVGVRPDDLLNGVQPLTLAFDGFLVHSRGGAAAPLVGPDQGIDLAGAIGGQPTQIRTDLDAPVLMVETETDLVVAASGTTPPARTTPTRSGCGRSPAPPTPTPTRSGRAADVISLLRPDQRRAAALRHQGGAAQPRRLGAATARPRPRRPGSRSTTAAGARPSSATTTASPSAASAPRRSTRPRRSCRATPPPGASIICMLLRHDHADDRPSSWRPATRRPTTTGRLRGGDRRGRSRRASCSTTTARRCSTTPTRRSCRADAGGAHTGGIRCAIVEAVVDSEGDRRVVPITRERTMREQGIVRRLVAHGTP